jgi:hypothetical protein
VFSDYEWIVGHRRQFSLDSALSQSYPETGSIGHWILADSYVQRVCEPRAGLTFRVANEALGKEYPSLIEQLEKDTDFDSPISSLHDVW